MKTQGTNKSRCDQLYLMATHKSKHENGNASIKMVHIVSCVHNLWAQDVGIKTKQKMRTNRNDPQNQNGSNGILLIKFNPNDGRYKLIKACGKK